VHSAVDWWCGSPWSSLPVFYTYGHIKMNAAAVQRPLLNSPRINS
jgi:hypothetical protein